MLTDDLDYDLPPELIAQVPIEPRDAARLLVDRGPGLTPIDSHVSELHELILAGDVLVVNETRVLPARIAIHRLTGAAGEVLLLKVHSGADHSWEALCRPSRKLAVGEIVTADAGDLQLRMETDLGEGRWIVTPLQDGVAIGGDRLLDALAVSGVMPLPPYITEVLEDQDRYQTLFANRVASAAAPTAGLHFTGTVIDAVTAQGASIHTVELVVGLDTFRPITAKTVEDHEIHTEWYRVPEQTWTAVEEAKRSGGRVVAVGTTSVRALESRATSGRSSGDTALFIYPGYDFKVVDVMLTNFHMPRTSLLAMIEAFVGPRWRDIYGAAVERRYRFLSFGDAMILQRSSNGASSAGVAS
ncbi:MAG: tRNA preQ1(34) S-adenosylmethionine ribosyltransferase-isomerase QueA [Microthrixaceae bacterium]